MDKGPNLFEYTDYRRYLADTYQAKKAENYKLEFEKLLKGFSLKNLGEITANGKFTLTSVREFILINTDVDLLLKNYRDRFLNN